MPDLKSLIAELEAAKEGSRGLSDKVLLACEWTTSDGKDARERYWCSPGGKYYDWWDDPHARSRTGPPLKRPDPTRSLDDALTLVPEEEDWRLHQIRERWDGSWDVFLLCRGARHPDDADVQGNGATRELASCIAALKAREAA
ncbi:hypothetical protein LCGC14_2867830 [marine sediment metagenome]|uniref:Phage ABA sandwich domain-containing protein n=1 Tax=marine sediment metagenome TaxID=412755 RepID=A0A0F8YQJ1_9ZZZZ